MTEQAATQAQDATNQNATGQTQASVDQQGQQNQATQQTNDQGNQGASQTATGATGWDGKPIRPEDHIKVVDERKRFKAQANALSTENQQMKAELEQLKREKMSDTEKLQSDFEAYKTQASSLAEENRKLRYQNIAITAGATDHEFIAWKLEQAIKADEKVDPSNVLKDLKASHPALFRENGNGNGNASAQTGTTDQGQTGTTQGGTTVATPQGGAGATVEGSRGQRTITQIDADLEALGASGRMNRTQLRQRMQLLQERESLQRAAEAVK